MTNSTKNLSSNFLPAYFRTDANKKFNQSTIDQLIQPGAVQKVNGYIGRQNSKTTKGSDIFLTAPSKDRSDYQLEPSLVIKDSLNNVTFFKDYQDYINQLAVFGGNVTNHARLNEGETYSWNPHICWDRLVNFQNYYWLPNGPDVIRLYGDNTITIDSSFSVSVESQIDTNAYVFSTTGELGLVRNPLIKLYKGHTYRFEFKSLNDMFSIKTIRALSGSNYTTSGLIVDLENFIISFTVPNNAPDVLYYQNEQDIELGGVFNIQPITSLSTISIDREILGKKTCTINNVVLSNGMKVSFGGQVSPAEYSTGNYYVEGVGNSIKLISEADITPIPTVSNTESSLGNTNIVGNVVLVVTNTAQIQLGDTITSVMDNYFAVDTRVIEITNTTTVKLNKAITKSIPPNTPLVFVHDIDNNIVAFDVLGFDRSGFDGLVTVSSKPDYLTINRSSIDRNSWSRRNRWFHQSVIEASAAYNNVSVNLDQESRATRPIIEFEPDLRLFNSGTYSIDDVDLIDTVTTDIFSNIEGQPGYIIDGIELKHNHRVLFINDNDHLVNNRVYRASFIDVLHTTSTTTETLASYTTANISIPGSKTLYFESGSIEALPYNARVSGVGIPDNSIVISYTDSSITINNVLGLIPINTTISITRETYSITKQIHLTPIEEPQQGAITTVLYGARNQGNTYWYNNQEWISAQTKTQLNQAPLFYMVDANGAEYNDASVYTGSQFKGTQLFSYQIGTGANDSVLGFPLSYRNLENIGDIVFDFNLETDSFIYKSSNDLITQKIDTGYLVKLTLTGSSNVNGWITNSLVNKQPGIRIYKNTNLVTAVNIIKNHKYTIQSIESTDFVLFGATTNTIGETFIATKSGSLTDTGFVLKHDYNLDLFDTKSNLNGLKQKISLFVNDTKIAIDSWELLDAAVYYVIRLNSAIGIEDVLTIKTYLSEPINSNGYYEIPINLKNNPLNESIATFTLGEVINHVKSIVENTQDFVGVYPGSGNLRDLGNTSAYGTRFVQHSDPVSLAAYHITSQSNNIVHAIEQNRDDYAKFKRNFIMVAESLGVIKDTREQVDAILQEMNKDKIDSFPYSLSDMVPYGGSLNSTFTVLDPHVTAYPLNRVFSLDKLSNQAVGVYLNEIQLCYGRDYTFDPLGFVIITATLSVNDIIIVYEYDSTDGCFVPETPTKLGLWPKYEPIIYTDTSLVTPRTMIRGHDGSSILAYDDYRDQLILELELRIYNNIKVKYDPSIFDIYSVIPGYNRTTSYSLEEFNSIIAQDFYKWTLLINKDYAIPYGFDRSNPLTYNYAGFGAPDGRAVPAYWHGIYKWLLDTDQPNLFPWECLGFFIKPTWWESVYGPAPYTSDNLVLWSDLAQGVIREPGQPPVYTKFARPYLSNKAPVDEYGHMQSPLDSGLVTGTLGQSIQNNFVFGDIGPVEAAWRKSSYYPFSVLHAAMLMNPSKFSVMLDRSRVIRNSAGQLVYSTTNRPIRPQDIILPSTGISTTRIQTAGLINYLVNYIQSDNTKRISDYTQELLSLLCQLSYRVSGFTAKEKFKLLMDSKSPNALGNVFVPEENYHIILNSSSPIKKLTYSGVIITRLPEGFSIKGYSQSSPYFNYYPWIQSGIVLNIGGISEGYSSWTSDQQYVAGKIVEYNNHYYRVKLSHRSTTIFESQYYQSLPSLPIVGGQEAIIRKRWDRDTIITIPYNTIFRTIQEVVDFLLGYGEYLKDQGFVFEEFNSNFEQVQNWETSAKEFLFWTTQNWSTGQDKWQDWTPELEVKTNNIVKYFGDYYQAIRPSKNITPDAEHSDLYFERMEGLSSVGSSVIAISPAATKLTFNTPLTVVDDITNDFNEYEIVAVDGKPIPPNFLNSYHDSDMVSYTPGSQDGIFGASFYLIQKEHVVLLDNNTVFNDIIYNTPTGYKRDRLKVIGYTSIDWNGSFNIPGFILDQAIVQDWSAWQSYALGDIVKYKEFYYSANSFLSGSETFNASDWYKLEEKPTSRMIPNWTYKAHQFTDFYDLDSDNVDSTQQKMAQHLIGYQKRQYLSNIIQDDVSEFKFYQGMIVEKGTKNVFNKLFDALNSSQQDSITFNEEWALRVGRYGANNAFENIEFILNEAEFKNNPQGFELVPQYTQTNIVDFIIRPTPNDVYLKPVGYSSAPWPTHTTAKNYFRRAGHVRTDDIQFVMRTLDDIYDMDSNNNPLYPIAAFNEGDYIWCTFVNTLWDVYKYTSSDIKVVNIVYNVNELTITADQIVTLTVGSYIGLTYLINDWATDINYHVNDIVTYNKLTYKCTVEHTSNIFNTDLSGDKWISITSTGTGFYRVVSVSNNNFVVQAPMLTTFVFDSLKDKSLLVYEFKSQKINSIDLANDVIDHKTKSKSLLWIDSSPWSTWINNSVYMETDVRVDSIKAGMELGHSIVMNSTSTLLAIATATGLIHVYDRVYSGDQWVRRQIFDITPNTIDPALKNSLATVMSMTSAGDWIFIGSPLVSLDNNLSIENGFVLVYQLQSNNVYKLFTTLTGEQFEREQFGASLAVTNVKTTNYIDNNDVPKTKSSFELFIGANQSAIGSNRGQVINVIFECEDITSINPVWTNTTGSFDIIGDVNTNFGQSLAVVDSTLTISEPGNSTVPGRVHVYKNDGTKYNESEFDVIIGDLEQFGRAIALTPDGNNIAISSTLYDDVAFDQGIVYVYSLVNDAYELYQSIKSVNPQPFERFGEKLAFSNLGSSLIIYSKHGNSSIEWQLTDGTEFDSGTTVFLIEYGQYSGRVDVYDRYNSKWVYGETLTAPVTNEYGALDQLDGYGTGFAVGDDTVVIGAPLSDHYVKNKITNEWVIDKSNVGRVYSFARPINTRNWTLKNYEIAHVDLSQIKRAFLYDKSNSKLLTYLDIVDVSQGKIPGPADQELSYKTFYDPAIYSTGEANLRIDPGSAWTREQVGKLWWDLSTVKFVESYDSNVVYRNSTWNSLAYGATVDVYEWVETTLTPESWTEIADTEEGLAIGVSGTPFYTNTYSVNQTYDNISASFKNTYYYWVKNKRTIPDVSFRSLSAQAVSDLIANPRGQGYVFLALTGTNSFSLFNTQPLLNDDNVILSVDYWTAQLFNKNIHTQWRIFDPESNNQLPQNIEEKWFDSLCGKDLVGRPVPDTSLPQKIRYGIENRPRQGMFVNPLEALKQTIEYVNQVLIENPISDIKNLSKLTSYDPIPNAVRGLYDQVIETEVDLQYVSIGSYHAPNISPIIVDGSIIGIEIHDSGSNYFGNRPYTDTTWYGPPINVIGSGVDCNAFSEVNARGEIVGSIIINGGQGYDSNTVCQVRSYSVLVNNDTTIDGMWSIYTYNSGVWSRIQSQAYDTRKYWEYRDWYATGYSQFTSPHYTVQSYNDLTTITSAIGELVRVTTTGNGSWVLLEKYATGSSSDWTTEYRVIGSQNGTIQFLESLYLYGLYSVGYDASLYDDVPYDNVAATELRNIFICLRDDILIDELKHKYIGMFMASLRYVLSEQLYVDWVFKTSFINAVHNVGSLTQTPSYQSNTLEDYENYINEVKPYRTKIREYVSKYDTMDTNSISMTDFDLPPISTNNIISVGIDNDQITASDAKIQEYPWKYWYDNVGLSVTAIDVIDAGSQYLMNPVVEIHGACRVPAKATAYIANGYISKIIIDEPGAGYLTTPTIVINGSTYGTVARAVAKLGNSLTKSTLIRMKFDRISQTYLINQLLETEIFSGTGVRRQFALKWSPDLKIGQSTVTINGSNLMDSDYALTTVKSTARGYTAYSGAITFTTPPIAGSIIVVEYYKNWDCLTATDRIQFCYDPAVGELGQDLAQLMTGIDYNGVIIDGMDFNIASVWGGSAYFDDYWGSTDESYDDYITAATVDNIITLPYIPPKDTLITVYHIQNITETTAGDGIKKNYSFNHLINQPQVSITTKTTTVGNFNLPGNNVLNVYSIDNIQIGDRVVVDIDGAIIYDTRVIQRINANTVKLDKVLYQNIPVGTTVTFVRPLQEFVELKIISSGLIMLTHPVPVGSNLQVTGTLEPNRIDGGLLYADGISATIDISGFNQNVIVGDILIVRKDSSDGSIAPSDYDSAISGGALYAYGSATGLNAEDLIMDGDNFISSTAPEEVIPGQVLDTVAIKSFFITGVSYMQFKDMLNRVHHKRLNRNKQTTLARELKITDLTIEVVDATNFDIPDRANNRPGIIEVYGERIEYFTINDNVLGQLRRSTLGTSAKMSYPVGTIVQDIGPSETIPYNDINQIDKKIISGIQYLNWSVLPQNVLTGIILHSPNDTKYILKTTIDGMWYAELFVNANNTMILTAVESAHLLPGQGIYIAAYNGAIYNHTVTDLGIMVSEYIDQAVNMTPYYMEIPTGGFVLRSPTDNACIISVTNEGVVIVEDVQNLNDHVGYLFTNVDHYNEYVDYTISENNDIVELDYVPQKTPNSWNIINHQSIVGILLRSPNDQKYILTVDNSGNLVVQSLEYAQGIPVIIARSGNMIPPGAGFQLESNSGDIYSLSISNIEILGAENIEDFLQTETLILEFPTSNSGLFLSTNTEIWAAEYITSHTQVDPFILQLPNPGDGIILTSEDNASFKITVNDAGGIVVTVLTSLENEIFYSIPPSIIEYGQCDDIEVFVGGYDIKPWAPNTEFITGDYIVLNSYTYKCLVDHTSNSVFYKDWSKWQFFANNHRLIKTPYSLHNANIAPESPEGDADFIADFMVDGIQPQIKLTNKLKSGTKVTVVKRTGQIWNDDVLTFVSAVPGSLYQLP